METKKINFHKMHGLGNDFILLNEICPDDYDLSRLAVGLCDRHLGIGADGIMLVLPSETADVQMRIINADGSEADMCGNGIRCFARYVFEQGWIKKDTFSVETRAGIILPQLVFEDGAIKSVKVNMGSPKFKPADIPMLCERELVLDEPLDIDGTTYFINSLLMGVPHTMIFVEELDSIDLDALGPKIERHALFPQGTNVNFVQVVHQHEIKVRTWERGAGRTLACGTGSCASAVASILNHSTEGKVVVQLALGALEVEWINGSVYMTGPASNICSGLVEVDEHCKR